MKIVVIVRTRNEIGNIARFCDAYSWADDILIADGGSNDCTLDLAATFSNTRMRPFLERTKMENGYWRNPAGDHINFLIEWAEELRADWIIFDDCDCVPNKKLQETSRKILEECPANMIYAVRLHLYKSRYFPRLSKDKEGFWTPGLWGWKAEMNLRFRTNPINHTHEFVDDYEEDNLRLEILPPSCLLHYAWPNESVVKKKLKFYKESGQHPTAKHPLKFGGKLEELPVWAV